MGQCRAAGVAVWPTRVLTCKYKQRISCNTYRAVILKQLQCATEGRPPNHPSGRCACLLPPVACFNRARGRPAASCPPGGCQTGCSSQAPCQGPKPGIHQRKKWHPRRLEAPCGGRREQGIAQGASGAECACVSMSRHAEISQQLRFCSRLRPWTVRTCWVRRRWAPASRAPAAAAGAQQAQQAQKAFGTHLQFGALVLQQEQHNTGQHITAQHPTLRCEHRGH